MLKEPVTGLPAASVALQVTRVVVMAKVAPDGGTQVTGTSPLTISVAVALKLTAVPLGAVASKEELKVGSVREGAVVSTAQQGGDKGTRAQ